MFDSQGNELSSKWWTQASLFAQSSGSLLTQRHVRRAPFDGLLHLLGDTVYTSITQLLIRRSLFSRTGLFESRWGSLGDFNWNMRAGLIADTVHVPDTWGGWRQHEAQATAGARFGSAGHIAQMDEMIDHAIGKVGQSLDPQIRKGLLRKWAPRMHSMRHLELAMRSSSNPLRRRISLLRHLAAGSWFARWHLSNRLKKGPDFSESMPRLMAAWLEQQGMGPALVPIKAREYCSSC
jgi:uncharacterized protein YneF (UPF0154 family)